MEETVDLITILTEVAPLVLAVLMLSGVLILLLYAVIRVVIPAMRETVEMFEAQRQSWRSIIEEQNRLHKRLAEELEAELTEEREARNRLEERVGELEKALADKTTALMAAEKRIVYLEKRVEMLDDELAKRDERIEELEAQVKKHTQENKTLRAELNQVKADREVVKQERDDLQEQVNALKRWQEEREKTDGVTKPDGGEANVGELRREEEKPQAAEEEAPQEDVK